MRKAEGSRGRPGEQPYGMRNLRPTVRIANPSRVYFITLSKIRHEAVKFKYDQFVADQLRRV